MLTNKQITQVTYTLLIVGALLMASNMFTISSWNSEASFGQESTVAPYSKSSALIPTGVPKIYGPELGVSFDDVSPTNPQAADATIARLSQIDRTVELTGADLERYIQILYVSHKGFSCEYCCGARSIIFEDGKSACGCAHSYAMRGLAKYLITEHGDEYSDAEILEEVAKWKFLFFPTQMANKAAVMKEKGIELTYTNIGSNSYRGIEQGSSSSGGGMVGGC